MQYQQNEKELIKVAQNNKDYSIHNFHGADKNYFFTCKNHKIVIPKQLEKQVIECNTNVLCHPGETCTELSISQHFFTRIYVEQYVKSVLNVKRVSF